MLDAAILVIGVHVGFAVLAILLPYKGKALTKQDAGDYLKKYWFMPLLNVLLFFLFIPPIGYGLCLGFGVLAYRYAASLGPYQFVAIPNWVIWVFPSLYLSLLLGIAPIWLVMRTLLGSRRYKEFSEYEQAALGIDGFRFLKWLTAVICVAAGLYAWVALRTYARFDHSHIHINRVTQLSEQSYAYGDIKTIRFYQGYQEKSGNIVSVPFHTIDFADATGWETSLKTIHSQGQASSEKDLFVFLSRQSGVPIAASGIEKR